MRPLCGKKLSVCCMVLSVWGVLQLAIMGIFFQIGATAFFHDIPHGSEFNETEIAIAEITHNYKKTAINCWIAAAIYLLFFLLAMSQYIWGQKHEAAMRKLDED